VGRGRSRWLLLAVPAALATLLACAASDAPNRAGASSSEGAPQGQAAGTRGAAAAAAIPGVEQFRTDLSKHRVSYAEILSGGPPKDGIVALVDPGFVSVAQARKWLEPREPIVRVRVGDDVRAYPIQILIFHEMVNDSVGGKPLLVTFCPLCNTAIAFDRRVRGKRMTFGVTGLLRFSNMIMYDRDSESWWQQATGEAIAGEHSGQTLSPHPAEIIAWQTFAEAHPKGRVLSRKTGHVRPYGDNPYAGYDDIDNVPFLYRRGPSTPDRLPPMARVLTLRVGEESVAYPYAVLRKTQLASDVVAAEPVVVMWRAGTASALDDATIAEGRDVGAAAAYSRRLDDRVLTFSLEGERVVDAETASRWTRDGRAIDGPLAGRHLQPLAAINHFWFSWAAFAPQTRVYAP
jgi:Protein of unknown function (DUF3179)